MKTPETYEQIQSRAAAFAANSNTPFHSGHLLLAILTGNGAATNTLTLRGLTETKIRAKLRDNLKEEDENLVEKVESTAKQIASSVRNSQVTALHLLAAIATVRASRGHQILKECQLNVDLIRVQALRNMTSGLTREHGFGNQNKQLNISTVKQSNRKKETIIKKSPPTATAPPKSAAPTKSATSKPTSLTKRFIPKKADMGKQLEQAQKKTRQARTPAADESKQLVASLTLSPKDFPTLCSLGRNLTDEVAQGILKPIVGRVDEIEQIADILNKKRGNCPCLVGPPGVGKTAIVEGLACDMATGAIGGIHYEVIIEVSIANLLGGTTLRGELSEKIIEVAKEIQKSNHKVVLFFDDVHTLLGSQDATEAITELKHLIGNGDIPCIWATQDSEFNKHIDIALARLITTIDVAEPKEDEALEILAGVAPDYEDHHCVSIDINALRASVVLSTRYISDSYLPDKAVSIIDLAASQARRRGQDTVTEEDVAAVLAHKLAVPKERLSYDNGKQLLKLEQSLSNDIVGHEHALIALGESLRRNAAGFTSGRPIGSFLFLGPTGVGKTETAKSLAKLLFADEKAMIRLDMSEFSEAHAVSKLMGAPPGYIGHEDGGQLTDAVRKKPYSIVLLDEIEKAHRDVSQSLLQVLDDGRLTDGKGKTVDFKNTVVIMTSNLGADLRVAKQTKRSVGFGATPHADDGLDNIEQTILNAARASLSPELWNRIDEPLVFHPLAKEDVSKIAKLMLNRLATQILNEKDIHINVGNGVIEYLINQGGYDLELGARPMRRTISRHVEGPLARIILSECQPGDTINISNDEGKLLFYNVSTA